MTQDLRAMYPSSQGLEVIFVDGSGLEDCPPCIENHEQAVQSTLALLPRSKDAINTYNPDGVLVCCFSDHPLVYALRESFTLPVTGIFQAALQDATADGGKFGIITTADAWEPILEKSVKDFGLYEKCTGVKATGLGVLELESLPRPVVVQRIGKHAMQMVEHGADSIVLGCAGMANLEADIRRTLPSGVWTIDGVRSGIQILMALEAAGSGTDAHPAQTNWAVDGISLKQ
jgi:allantoin racemase